MNIRKFLAVLVAAAMCFSFCMAAYAVNGAQRAPEENVTNESTTAENSTDEESTSQEVTEEPSSEEASSEENSTDQDVSEESSKVPEEDASEESSEVPEEDESEESSSEESSEAPDEDDVIALIINLLGKINLEEVKDAFNDINEALGLPRIESYTDIPAYADALYGKLEEMGLGYGDIINGLASSDLLDWLNKLIFGGGSSVPSTTVPSEDSSDDFFEEIPDSEESPIPDTGVSFGVVAAAVAAMGGSGALALILRKRDSDEE